MRKSFVILAMQRTGSVMMVKAISTHPRIHCFGEIFRRSSGPNARALDVLDQIDPVFSDNAYRHSHQQAYVDAVFATRPHTDFIGFKLMLNQNSEYRNRLIDDPAWGKVLLYRSNLLAAYSSEKIAQTVREAPAASETPPIEFKAEEFERFRQHREQLYHETENRIVAADADVLRIEYLEAASMSGIRKVVAHLGAEPDPQIVLPTRKRNTGRIAERFSNPDAARAHLARIGMLEWENEFLGPTPVTVAREPN